MIVVVLAFRPEIDQADPVDESSDGDHVAGRVHDTSVHGGVVSVVPRTVSSS